MRVHEHFHAHLHAAARADPPAPPGRGDDRVEARAPPRRGGAAALGDGAPPLRHQRREVDEAPAHDLGRGLGAAPPPLAQELDLELRLPPEVLAELEGRRDRDLRAVGHLRLHEPVGEHHRRAPRRARRLERAREAVAHRVLRGGGALAPQDLVLGQDDVLDEHAGVHLRRAQGEQLAPRGARRPRVGRQAPQEVGAGLQGAEAGQGRGRVGLAGGLARGGGRQEDVLPQVRQARAELDRAGRLARGRQQGEPPGEPPGGREQREERDLGRAQRPALGRAAAPRGPVEEVDAAGPAREVGEGGAVQGEVQVGVEVEARLAGLHFEVRPDGGAVGEAQVELRERVGPALHRLRQRRRAVPPHARELCLLQRRPQAAGPPDVHV